MTDDIRGSSLRSVATTPCAIVPPHLLNRLARAENPSLNEPARRTLALDAAQRVQRRLTAEIGPTAAPPRRAPDHPLRTICDVEHRQELPGRRMRGEGEADVPDTSVNHAYDGLGATFEFYLRTLSRLSIDGAGLPLDASVHFQEDYDNAFWDGEQMVFGDGDGRIFGDFTQSPDVIGHELTHGVTQYTANLTYMGQSGALNEHLSDVFGSLVEQFAKGETTEEANWLIGEELLRPEVQGVALRSMKAPGTAYDDDELGKDPQPAHMNDFVQTFADNGGVHINSGIPNHAFYLAATQLGGHAWDGAGRIWYDVLTGGELAGDADFTSFARLTADAADAYGPQEHDAVLLAWDAVGVPTNGLSRPVSQ
ncbi:MULTISPECIES: M4 family metallopeptidase [unclassified Streptomyces]|uniref:M4 family metallopeptidase n=1 Tax=unclassified Streptomyces TaxID=2593676 RepID=UPI002DDC8560|nr:MULTISPECIES: M4 family metallopeptidase [unclassified Streptomyces]WSD94315.1 M4 family metallopeptidase [Streptomyces sp. NBC_01474]